MFKRILIRSLIPVITFVLFNYSVTQAQTITGRVLDAQTKEALAGATVLQSETTNGVSTTPNGEFEITLISGKKELRVSYVGYKTKIISLNSGDENIEVLLLPQTYISSEVFVEATRVDDSTPMSYTNVTRSDIEEQNLGQDVPYLLQQTPSVTTTSDAGAGIGYTGIRIRGVDPARINVTINGIPVNDAESHGVFWVDLPDIASSVDNIQIQRGVGTSTNGAGAFGASINLQTSTNRVDPFAEVNTAVGSFNTRKANIMLGSGLMKNGWMFEGRLSKILSDGYIDRAFSDLNSFYLSASRQGKRSLLKADVFSGKEITYQAWYGVEESILESGNRTYNEAGTEKEGAPYENQVDNYRQDYYQLHYSYRFSESWTANASLHYTKGQGYYEEYKADESLADYGITPMPATQIESDLIRRRWLDNDFYGLVFSTRLVNEEWELTIGGGANRYDGLHFGEVIWARYAGDSEIEERYYDNDAVKDDINLYSKFNYYLSDAFNAYLDLQVRNIRYEFVGLDNDDVLGPVPIDDEDHLTFFNPKAGVVYRLDDNSRAFASFSVASKEPTRSEYTESTRRSRPEPETLYNIESGFRKEFNRAYAGFTGYAMIYKDQLILTGQINDVGAYVRENVPDSYRLGLELEGGVRLTDRFNWAANATLSRNKIESFTEYIDDYDNGGQIAREYSDTDIAFSPNLITTSILSYSDSGFTAEWTAKYVSRQYLDNTQNLNRSIDPYFVNDLRVSYRLSSLQFAKAITANLLINNILNEEYETNGYTFGFIAGGEQRYNYYYPQAGRNFLFQLKWEF